MIFLPNGRCATTNERAVRVTGSRARRERGTFLFWSCSPLVFLWPPFRLPRAGRQGQDEGVVSSTSPPPTEVLGQSSRVARGPKSECSAINTDHCPLALPSRTNTIVAVAGQTEHENNPAEHNNCPSDCSRSAVGEGERVLFSGALTRPPLELSFSSFQGSAVALQQFLVDVFHGCV